LATALIDKLNNHNEKIMTSMDMFKLIRNTLDLEKERDIIVGLV